MNLTCKYRFRKRQQIQIMTLMLDLGVLSGKNQVKVIILMKGKAKSDRYQKYSNRELSQVEDANVENNLRLISQLNENLSLLRKNYINSQSTQQGTERKQILQENVRMFPNLKDCFSVTTIQQFESNRVVILKEKTSIILYNQYCCYCGYVTCPKCPRNEQACYLCRYVVNPQECINPSNTQCLEILGSFCCCGFCWTLWLCCQGVDLCQYCVQRYCCCAREVKTLAGEMLDIYDKYQIKDLKSLI